MPKKYADTTIVRQRFIIGETVVVRLPDCVRPRVQLAEILDAPITETGAWTVRLQDGATAAVLGESLLERALLVRYPCLCCGCLTILSFDHGPPGTYETCPVCSWEDDYVTGVGGSNHRDIEAVRVDFETWRDAGMPEDARRRAPREDEAPERP